jgi:hypothetical protein
MAISSHRLRQKVVTEILQSLFYVIVDNLETFYTLILADFDLLGMFEMALPLKSTQTMDLKLARAALSLIGLMMSAEDNFMRMVFD